MLFCIVDGNFFKIRNFKVFKILIKVWFYFDILYCGFFIFEFWIRYFRFFGIIIIFVFDFFLKVKIKVYCG